MPRVSLTALPALLRSSPRGGALVEFALILPFLVLLMVGLFDFGVGFWQYMQVHAAAEAGAQYAALHPADTAGITAAVRGATGTDNISAIPSQVCGCPGNDPFEVLDCTVKCGNGNLPGHYAKVSARVPYSPVLPYPNLPPALTGHAYRRLN